MYEKVSFALNFQVLLVILLLLDLANIKAWLVKKNLASNIEAVTSH